MPKRRAGFIPLLAAALLGAALLPGQWVPTRQYGTREGLAQSQVNAMVQDARGYLWAATHGGLSRFNGRRFTTFTTLNGLPDDVLSCLAADREGRVWVGADSGRVALWDGRSLRELPEPDPARRTPVTALLALPGGRVLLGMENGLWVGSEAGFERVDPDPVREIVPDEEGGAWVLGEALARWGGRRLEPFPAELPEPASRLVAVRPDGGAIWMLRDDGLVLQWRDRRWARFQVPVQEPKAAVPRPGGGLWIGGRNGLWLLRPDGRVEYHRLKSNEPATPVASLLVDREGSLWIGTFTEGMVQEISMPLTLFTRESGLASTTVWSFAEDPLSGCVWMGSESEGLLEWCEGRGWAGPIGTGLGLPSPRAIAVAAAPGGGVWVGTHRGLALVRGGAVQRVWGAGDGLPDPYIRALLPDPGGALWVGTAGGLARLDGERWTTWTPAGGMPCPVVRGLARDPGGNLWVATHSCGLLQFDGGAFETFDTRRGLPNDRVWCVMADSAGRVWAGTDGGLWVHPQDGRPDFTLGLEHGLPSLNVLFLLEDAAGDIWAGTTRGTARLSPEGRLRRVYTAADGFSDSEAAENAALMDRQGRLWFGFANGVTRLDAEDRDPELPTPVPVIERLLVNGSEVGDRFPLAGGTMSEAAAIELEAGASELRFEFAALSFLSPAGVRFRFMLERYDPEWSMPTEEDHVTYRNLPPGSYRFLLKAMAGKAWSERPSALRLVLHPAWYATSWFRSLAGGGALLLLGGLLWMRIAGERRQKARLEHEVAQRTGELQEANRLILEQNRQLEAMSRTDPLTGLGNRRVIEEQLPLEIALQRREMQRVPPGDMGRHFGLALFMLDLDGFKPVNDRLGHDMGDLVLKGVGVSFQRSLREVDLCVRWGGDEFLVLCRSLDRKGVLEVAGRLVEEIAHLRISGPGQPAVAVTPSVGFVAYPFRRDCLLASSQWGLLVQAADRYLYLAKERGRARACGVVVAGAGEDGVTEEETVRRVLASPHDPPSGLEFHEVTVQARLGPPPPTP
jgi:diguanylate cyclase (GGDEF)-like protein